MKIGPLWDSLLARLLHFQPLSGSRGEGGKQGLFQGLGEFFEGLAMTAPLKNPLLPQPTPYGGEGVGGGDARPAPPPHRRARPPRPAPALLEHGPPPRTLRTR